MRRIKLVLAVITVMVAMLVTVTAPAVARGYWPNYYWGPGYQQPYYPPPSCGWYWSYWQGWTQWCWSPLWGWYQISW